MGDGEQVMGGGDQWLGGQAGRGNQLIAGRCGNKQVIGERGGGKQLIGRGRACDRMCRTSCRRGCAVSCMSWCAIQTVDVDKLHELRTRTSAVHAADEDALTSSQVM